jgi:curved DNA-binding protein CbpA
MKTLYDLLGALPHDDAEGLRTAFRRAVKGAHPDIRPGDPDAAFRFREIVRANEILGDAEQREAYDHLLELARLEQEPASRRALASRIHELASGVIALTGASAVIVGGYLLFMYMSSASVASANNADVNMRAASEIAAVSRAGSADTADTASPAKRERTSIPGEAIGPRAAKLQTDAESGPAPDLAASEARSLQARGISVYRDGDLNGSIADFDWAFQFHPKLLPAYIEPAVIFYRLRKFDGVFPGTAPAKPSRLKSAPAIARKPLDQAAVAPSVTPSRRWRTAAQDPSRGEVIPQMR